MKNVSEKPTNPILKTDYPDVDVIRVEDTYYMVSTTMYFYPGCVILRSYNLVDWEIAGYVYDTLESMPEERLEDGKDSYGKGMWAASLRFHEGRFYVCFGAIETGRTYIFSAESVEGEWEKKVLEGYYHDSSLFFGEDGRVFLIYGNTEIKLVELEPDLSGVRPEGFRRVLVTDTDNVGLGYEGSHFYYIGGRYYLFVLHWPKYGNCRRTQLCFASDSLEGEFQGKTVLDDDLGYHNQGVAQGGIVEAVDGRWYAPLFQDRGAVGRIPVLVPITWEDGFPVFGENGRVPVHVETADSRPGYIYEKLYASDDFQYETDAEGHCRLKKQWQWNHEPQPALWSICPEGGLRVRTGKISYNLTEAVNTLTQRMMFPESAAEVTLDASDLKEGDFAGLCALQGYYGLICVTRYKGKHYLVMRGRKGEAFPNYAPNYDSEMIELEEPVVRLRACACFEDMKDYVEFFYEENGQWKSLGERHRLYFRLDHFTGCRYGLFIYSTKEIGGSARFTEFRYECE